MKKILIIGSSNVDTTMHVADFPQPGETINASEVTSAGGGKGANQAIAAARSGAETTFLSRVGQDSFGDFLLSQLQKAGVNTEFVSKTAGANTGHAYIALTKSGENNIILDHGANYKLTPVDVEHARSAFKKAVCVIAQFETPLAATIAAFKKAKANHALTILNPAPALKKIPPELIALTDLITPNETESAAITGIKIHGQKDLRDSAAFLHQLGIANVVITYGAKGAYLSNKFFTGLIPAFKVRAVDTTGAGDTFIGYLASELKPDLSNLKEAAIFASRASSLAVQQLGAQPSIPKRQEVKRAEEKDNE